MPRYEVVGVRFNMEDEIESKLYDNLNTKNRAGHIKKILKEVFLGSGHQVARRSYIEEVVKDLMSNMNHQINIEIEPELLESSSLDEIDLLSAVSNIMRGE